MLDVYLYLMSHVSKRKHLLVVALRDNDYLRTYINELSLDWLVVALHDNDYLRTYINELSLDWLVGGLISYTYV